MSRTQAVILSCIVLVYGSLGVMGQISFVPKIRMPEKTIFYDENAIWDDGKSVTLKGVLSLFGDSSGNQRLLMGSGVPKIWSDNDDDFNVSSSGSISLRSATDNIALGALGNITLNSDQNAILTGSSEGIGIEADGNFVVEASSMIADRSVEFGGSTNPKVYYQPYFDGYTEGVQPYIPEDDVGIFDDEVKYVLVAPNAFPGSYLWKVEALFYRESRDDGSLNFYVYEANRATRTRSLLASTELITLNSSDYDDNFLLEHVLHHSFTSGNAVYVVLEIDSDGNSPVQFYGLRWHFYERAK